MESKVPELEEFIIQLNAELELETALKEDICVEIRQSLYDKLNELLIKGYGIETSISCTLEGFEDPKRLAKMFNSTYEERVDIDKAIRFIYNRKSILVAIIATLLMIFVL